MTRFRLACWLLLLPMTLWAQAPSAVDAFLAALRPLQHVQGEFSQRQYDGDGTLLAESSGRFMLLRPGYFFWEIRAPDDQLIVADPNYVWHHDRDLATVTRRPVAAGGEMTPLQILGGDEEALRAGFEVAETGPGQFRLTASSTEIGFRQLTIELADGTITGMEVFDNLGQRIAVKFSNVDTAAPLSPADFAFTPPPDADLFYHDE